MNKNSLKQKEAVIDIDDIDIDLESDKEFSRYRESNTKARHRRNIKRRLDQIKENRWLKQHSWLDDEILSDFSDLNI